SHESSWDWTRFAETIRKSALSEGTQERSMKVFERLQEAEKRVHDRNRVELTPHLDELGTIDTLIDIVGFVAGLEILGIDSLYSAPLPMGSGIINTKHGILPSTAPATLELISMAMAPVHPRPPEFSGELVTPTGAALITTLACFERPIFNLFRVGYGLGARDPKHYPNAVALLSGEIESSEILRDLIILETNVDDMTPQLLGYVQETLMNLGVLDVWFTSIQMKKNRPGILLSLLLPPSLETQAINVLFRETSTLGVRRKQISRYETRREIRAVETSLGEVSVKIKYLDGVAVTASPEYEECRSIAVSSNLPLEEVLRTVKQEATALLIGKERLN
ncbi:LarC family nickel insertion protein, partial [SAR202 cluster bacterium AD-802-E10_MRT_200m]|nr:LarC family nickel insertion protein [SAR202 cluster bacterium AD-802-E10_MRT_200m]